LKQEDRKRNHGRKSKTVPKGLRTERLKMQRGEKQKAKEKQNNK